MEYVKISTKRFLIANISLSDISKEDMNIGFQYLCKQHNVKKSDLKFKTIWDIIDVIDNTYGMMYNIINPKLPNHGSTVMFNVEYSE